MADAAELVVFGPDGEPDEQRTRRRFEALAEGGGRVVVPGFYGADVNGRIQTFPRNGSDITGALAAEGMGAGLYENWSDVPGLMTADPAIVKDARLIPQVGYRQMRLIARSGAQVLHPSCLDPVASAGIPTRLRNTLCPDSFGTLVDEHVQRFAPCLVGKRRARLPGVDGGASEVSQISVFGVPEERVGKAAASLEPLLIEKGDCQTCVYVPKALYERTLQVLHQRLLSPDPS